MASKTDKKNEKEPDAIKAVLIKSFDLELEKLDSINKEIIKLEEESKIK